MTEPQGGAGFVAFFRRYAKTWYHTVATAALTLFGTLTFVDRLFAAVAVASYVLPPVALYLTDALPAADGDAATADERGEPSPTADRADGGGGAAGATEPRPDSDAAAEVGTGGAGPARSGPADAAADEAGADPTSESEPEPEWRRADAPTDETLADVVVTGAGAYAVGDAGSVVARGPDGWSVAVPDGPGAESNALTGVDATDDGVWFAGENGAVGRLDAETGRHVDYSAPADDTSNVADVAAAGGSGGETVLLVDGSGRVRRGRYRDGEVAWDDPVTPGSGSSLSGVALAGESTGYLCDTNGSVFALADRGAAFERVGVDDAGGTFTDVAALGPDACAVAADDGVVHRYDGATWTPRSLGDDPLWALAADGDDLLASADGGAVYERSGDAADWERVSTPVTAALRGVSLDGPRAVAVGDGGAVVERARRDDR